MSRLIFAAVLTLSLGCSSSPTPTTPEDSPAQWWNEPAAFANTYAGLGSFQIVSNAALARTGSANKGREALAKALQSRVDSLVAVWIEADQTQSIPQSLITFLTSEDFRRTHIHNEAQGALAYRYQQVGNLVHCLVLLEPERVSAWLDEIDLAVAEFFRDAQSREADAFRAEMATDTFRERVDTFRQKELDRFGALLEQFDVAPRRVQAASSAAAAPSPTD